MSSGVLSAARELAGELLYYLRDIDVPLYVWPSGPVPADHYEMTRPFSAATPEPILYVSLRRCPATLADEFAAFRRFSVERVKLVEKKTRLLHFCRLSGYRGTAARNG